MMLRILEKNGVSTRYGMWFWTFIMGLISNDMIKDLYDRTENDEITDK